MRTCIGCRARDDARHLVRIVAQGDSCVVDRGRGLPGRGAYLHPSAECLDRAEQRSSVVRALRASGPLRLDAVRAEVLTAPTPSATADGDSSSTRET